MDWYLSLYERDEERRQDAFDSEEAFRFRVRKYAELYLQGVELPDNQRELAVNYLKSEVLS